MQKLAPEHLLQLACYQWLDAMEKVQEHVVKAKTKEAMRKEGKGLTRASTSTPRTHRGFKVGLRESSKPAASSTTPSAHHAVQYRILNGGQGESLVPPYTRGSVSLFLIVF